MIVSHFHGLVITRPLKDFNASSSKANSEKMGLARENQHLTLPRASTRSVNVPCDVPCALETKHYLSSYVTGIKRNHVLWNRRSTKGVFWYDLTTPAPNENTAKSNHR